MTNSAGPPALFVMRELAFGGAERLASGILQDIAEQGRQVVLVVCRGSPEQDESTAWFPEPIRLVRLDEKHPSFTAQIGALGADIGAGSLTLFGRSLAFRTLPTLRRLLPNLKMTSFQFNEHELTTEHILYSPLLDRIVVEGAIVAGALIGAGVSSAKIEIIQSGPELARFDGDGVEGLAELNSSPRPRIGFVGRIDPIKGPTLFVQMASRLRSASLNCLFVVAGDGPAKCEMDAAIDANGLRDCVIRLGRLPAETMPSLYASLDLVVAPSLIDGRPLAIQEAQASGTPVVAFAVGSIPDLIEDRVTGRLVEPGDVELLAEAVTDLLARPEELRRLGEAARSRIMQSGGLEAALPRYRAAILA